MSIGNQITEFLLSLPLVGRAVEFCMAIWNREVGWMTVDRKVMILIFHGFVTY